MKIPSAAYHVGIFTLIVAIVFIVATQLNTDASPAAAFCTAAERQGVPCATGPKYDAQVVVVTDATGQKAGYLVISDAGKQIGLIPLQ